MKVCETLENIYVLLSQMFLSFYKEVINAQHSLFYIILLDQMDNWNCDEMNHT